jgi:hypothetical protein
MALTWQQNSLQMEWSLDCHRNTEQVIRSREFVATMGDRRALLALCRQGCLHYGAGPAQPPTIVETPGASCARLCRPGGLRYIAAPRPRMLTWALRLATPAV